jgi:cyanate permease
VVFDNAAQTPHVSVRGYGLLLASSAAGSVIGGLVYPVLARRAGPVPLLVMVACIGPALAVGMGLAPDAVVLGALMACGGWGRAADRAPRTAAATVRP